MTIIENNILKIKAELPSTVKLVAVSKFKPNEDILEAYRVGQRAFGESRPQEFMQKVAQLPKDIEWHFIGHLQTNKLKMVLPYVYLIHSVDSKKLLLEIDKYAQKHNLKVNILLELFIAREESKQGFSKEELLDLLNEYVEAPLKGVNICGLMGMASFVDDSSIVEAEFTELERFFFYIKDKYGDCLPSFNQLSMGMSGDFKIALKHSTTMVRIGTTIFGGR